MKQYFDTKAEAEEYRQKHELYARSVEYSTTRNKWMLVFPIKAQTKEGNQ